MFSKSTSNNTPSTPSGRPQTPPDTSATAPAAAAPSTAAPVSAPTPAPTPEPRRSTNKVAALITDNVTVEGGITGDGEVQIDGSVRGDIRVTRVTIGETGQVEGSVQAETVEIRGRVVGSVSAKQVRLYGSAHVDGDISHEQLAMEPGAFFQGRSLRLQRKDGSPSREASTSAKPANGSTAATAPAS